MIRTQVYIPDDLYYRAKLQAQQDKQSMSVILREGLQLSIKQRQKSNKNNKKSFDSLFGIAKGVGSKTTYIARDHNDIYNI